MQDWAGKLIARIWSIFWQNIPTHRKLRLEKTSEIKSSISGEAGVSLSRKPRVFRMRNKSRAFIPTFDRGTFAALLGFSITQHSQNRFPSHRGGDSQPRNEVCGVTTGTEVPGNPAVTHRSLGIFLQETLSMESSGRRRVWFILGLERSLGRLLRAARAFHAWTLPKLSGYALGSINFGKR